MANQKKKKKRIRRNSRMEIVNKIRKGDHIIFASVGAGMNINAIIYQV